MTDKDKAMSMFLQFRSTLESDIKFFDNIDAPLVFPLLTDRKEVTTADELMDLLRHHIQNHIKNSAIALSGGVDSAIIAALVPKGTTAYTFRCIVPGKKVTDESPRAKQIAEINGLNHKIVDIYWEDYLELTPILMKHKRAPVHSIEVQIYKAALQAKSDGFETFIFGENADIIFGGFSEFKAIA